MSAVPQIPVPANPAPPEGGGAVPPIRGADFPHMGIPIPEHGTRDNLPPLQGKRYVVCLGCSHTFGHTRAQHTWPAFLQRLLPRREYQVLNMGRRNYGLGLNIAWYREFARKLRPETCIIQIPLFCRQPFPGLQDDRAEHFTMKRGSLSLVRSRAIPLLAFIEKSSELVDRDLARLRDFLEELKRDGVTPVVLFYKTNLSTDPFLWDVVVGHHAKAERLCKEVGVAFCGGPELSNFELRRRRMLWNETHANEKGNLFLARRIYETAMCPPLPPLSVPRLARLELFCAIVSFARACGIAYRRKRKNKVRGDAGPVPSVDPDLPGEIYTLW